MASWVTELKEYEPDVISITPQHDAPGSSLTLRFLEVS